MSVEQAVICKRCRRENGQGDRQCVQCGADLALFDRRAFFVALGLTAIPFVITLFFIALNLADYADAAMLYGDVVTLLVLLVLMGFYVVVGVIAAALFHWRKLRSISRGILVGLGVGVILGIASIALAF